MKSVFLLFLALLIAFVACKDFPAVAPVTNTKASFFYYLESCENGQVGVVFDASASQELLRYDWDFGDGSRLDTTAAVVRHVYKNAAPETFLVVLQAKYDEMNVDSLTKTIIIDPNATLKWTKTGDQLGLSPFFGRTNWVGETPDGGVAATGFVKVDANSWTPMQMFVVKLDALGKLVFSILLSISGTSQSEGVAAIAEKDGSIIACGKALDTDSQWHLAVWNINNIGVVVSSYLVPTADEVAVDIQKTVEGQYVAMVKQRGNSDLPKLYLFSNANFAAASPTFQELSGNVILERFVQDKGTNNNLEFVGASRTKGSNPPHWDAADRMQLGRFNTTSAFDFIGAPVAPTRKFKEVKTVAATENAYWVGGKTDGTRGYLAKTDKSGGLLGEHPFTDADNIRSITAVCALQNGGCLYAAIADVEARFVFGKVNDNVQLLGTPTLLMHNGQSDDGAYFCSETHCGNWLIGGTFENKVMIVKTDKDGNL